jgi:uncharacterized protein
MPAISRRTLLHPAGGVAAGAVAASVLPAGTALAAIRPDIGVSVFPFPLPAVTLLHSPFLANMNRTLSYLSFVDHERLLHTFRLNVGLSSSAQPVGGWEAPDVELSTNYLGRSQYPTTRWSAATSRSGR